MQLGLYLLLGFFLVRDFIATWAKRSALTRQLLIPFIGQIVAWGIFGLFYSGWIAVMYYATLAVIFAPRFIWIYQSPKDDHVA